MKTEEIEINTRRRYQVAIFDGGNKLDTLALGIHAIMRPLKDDYEYIYALNGQLDLVLDLKPNEAMYFQPNRDGEYSKGIILRTN